MIETLPQAVVPELPRFRNKVITLDEAVLHIGRLQDSVLAIGKFNILRSDHIGFLRQATLAGILFVGIDPAAEELDGEDQVALVNRMAILASVPEVDYVFPFDEIREENGVLQFSRRIQELGPKYVALASRGAKRKREEEIVRRAGALVPVVQKWSKIQEAGRIF